MENKIQLIVYLITILGVFVAIIHYYNDKKTQKLNLILSVKAQLNELKAWASYNDNGYKNPPTISQQLRYMRIFDLIYDMDNSVTEKLLILPGIENFSNQFIQSTAKFNQNVNRIKSLISYRNNLQFNEYSRSIKIKSKFKVFESTRVSTDDINKFFDILRNDPNFNEEDVQFAELLYDEYFNLHSICIGDNNSGGLKESFNYLYAELTEKENRIKTIFILNEIPYYIFLTFLFYAFINIFSYLFFNGNWGWTIIFQTHLLFIAIILFILFKIPKIIK